MFNLGAKSLIGIVDQLLKRFSCILKINQICTCEKLNEGSVIYEISMSSCNISFAISWWRHQMETFSVLRAICAVPGELPAQRPVTRSFGVFFDLRLNKRLSKQSWGWWFETLSRPLWRQYNVGILARLFIWCSYCGWNVETRETYTSVSYLQNMLQIA